MTNTQLAAGAHASRNKVYVFVGTTAELIKLLPVIVELGDRRIPYDIISSGQNDIRTSELWQLTRSKCPDIVLHDQPIKQTSLGLLTWFLVTLVRSIFTLKKQLKKQITRQPSSERFMFVHGDTVSTLMGAILAKVNGMKVCHVEAGLRSFNYLKPFPEEICRVIVSQLADYAFCPNDWAVGNLKKHSHLQPVNTDGNTLIDSLAIAMRHPRDEQLFKLIPDRYFIFVMHRQENLFNTTFVRQMVAKVKEASRQTPCVMILHKPTEAVLRRLDLLKELEAEPDIRLIPRTPYISFTHLLNGAAFIVTDGGSNQEESYYLGKPCLILRGETERIEGLNENVLISSCNMEAISKFLANPEAYRRAPINPAVRPSKRIVDTLESRLAP